jgi:hypothetical protein
MRERTGCDVDEAVNSNHFLIRILTAIITTTTTATTAAGENEEKV